MAHVIDLEEAGTAGRRLVCAGLTALGALFGTACSEEEPLAPPPRPEVGWIVVGAAVTGEDVDADGFAVNVDGGAPHAVVAGGTLVFADLSPGVHTVRLGGVDPNCLLREPNSQLALVVARERTAVIFNATCLARTNGGILVRVSTPGFDHFGAAIGDGPVSNAQDGAVLLTGLTPGIHAVRLQIDPLTCQLNEPNPQLLPVTAGHITDAFFFLTCPPGSLVVSVTTTGTNRPSAYAVHVDQAGAYYCYTGLCYRRGVNATGQVWFDDLPLTVYHVTLGGVPQNCAAAPGQQTVHLPANGPGHVSFAISCR